MKLNALLWATLIGLMLLSAALNARWHATYVRAEDGYWVPRSFYATVPCSTDQDCAEKNPSARGLYTFPEKARNK